MEEEEKLNEDFFEFNYEGLRNEGKIGA